VAPLFGRVTVISDPPSARVTIDGREVGTSPLTTDDMEEGDHAITILGPPPQGLPWEGRVTVRAGTVTVVRVDLARPSPPSSASARSDVAGGTPDCATVCDRFAQVYTGPDSVREALRGQCLTRCQSGDVRFASCAANVRVTDDVQDCVALRVVANAARATSIPGSVQTDRPAEPEKTFCDKVCERLAAPLAGVAPNARPSRRTCLSRCAKNDIGYIACAWKVRVEGDAWKCTLLPEPGTTGATGTNTAETETAKSNRVDCRAVCEKYGEAFDGDDAIRGSIREQCEGRCFNGDMKFSVCAWKARNMDDVQTCASIPETR
jgi:hypothetical protein